MKTYKGRTLYQVGDYKITTIVDADHNGAPSRFDKKTYDTAYERENTTAIRLKLNNKTDADILAKLDSVPNKQGYIKQLIRNDIH